MAVDSQGRSTESFGTITLSGQPGDRFVLLKAPAVLTQFEGEGLRVTQRSSWRRLVLHHQHSVRRQICRGRRRTQCNKRPPTPPKYEYQLEAIKLMEGLPVLTGTAAVQEINLSYDEAGWEVVSPTAVRIESIGCDRRSDRRQSLAGARPGEPLPQTKNSRCHYGEDSVLCRRLRISTCRAQASLMVDIDSTSAPRKVKCPRIASASATWPDG